MRKKSKLNTLSIRQRRGEYRLWVKHTGDNFFSIVQYDVFRLRLRKEAEAKYANCEWYIEKFK